jgi:hypothetical protein
MGTVTLIDDNHPLVSTLRKIDPILQFLTKATGHTAITLPTIRQTLSSTFFSSEEDETKFLQNVMIIVETGLLHIDRDESCSSSSTSENDALSLQHHPCTSWDNSSVRLGFPLATSESSTSIGTIIISFLFPQIRGQIQCLLSGS